MGRFAAFLLLAAALVAGCSGSRSEEGASVPPAIDRTREAQQMVADAMAGRRVPVVPQGFRLRHEPSGVSVAFPRRWQALRGADARFPGVLETFTAYNPRLASAVRALAIPGSPLLMLAFDPREHRGATNANVLVASAKPGASYRDWSRTLIRDVRRLDGIRGDVRFRHVSLAAGDAVRIEFVRDSSARRLANIHYVVVRGDRLYSLAFTTLPELAKGHRKQFERSAQSLSLPG